MKLSHQVQFVEMEFVNRCATIRSFCSNVYPMLKASYEVYEHIRAEARARDIEADGDIPNDATYEHGEEIEVACEQAPVSEAIGLVGLFSLVYIVCALEKFFEAVLKSCGWKTQEPLKIKRALATIEKEVGGEVLQTDERELLNEVINARNDFVHRRGRADRAKKFVRDCGVDADGNPVREISFTRENVIEVTTELERISSHLVEGCKPFSASFP